MPKGPQGQKRPADTVANAIRVAKILRFFTDGAAKKWPLRGSLKLG